MPVGYTDKIKDGITFEEFVLYCARAFGACITMRDDPADKPIPVKFEPSRYHRDAIAQAKKRLVKLNKTTIEEAEQFALAEYNREKKRVADAIVKNRKLMAQYQDMLRQVEAWIPPTSEHIELKEFMIKQITSSINFDSREDYYTRNPVVLQTGEQWLQTHKGIAQKDIVYHTKEHEKEIEAADGRTEWVTALRNSLLCDNFSTPICDTCDKRFRCFTTANYKTEDK